MYELSTQVEGDPVSPKAVWLESLLEAMPDALVGMDQAGVIRFVNYQTESLFGYDRDELVGCPIQTLVPECLWEVFTEHQEGYFADPRARSMGLDLELIGRQRDGTDLPVNISMSRIDTGDVLLVMAATAEVSKRKQALENLQRMTAIVENSDDAIIAKTRDGIITSWNRAAETIYGYSSNEILGRSIEVLIPKERSGEMKTILAEVIAGRHVDHLETVRVRKNGIVFPMSVTVSPIRDWHGTIVGASTIARDMTARQGFQAARSMLESSLDSLVAISPEGKITDANEATVQATGIGRHQLIGMLFSGCFTDQAKANELYQLVFAKGTAVDYPLTMRHRDGTLTEVLYNASVYHDGGGNVLGVFASARDVTNRHRAQQEIAEQHAKALERLAELEHFQQLAVGRERKMLELRRKLEQRDGPPKKRGPGATM
jgi:PAS domain S-box-containing protein